MSTIAQRTTFPQVLLIEDSRGDAILVQRAFRKADIPSHVTVASTAEIALSILRREGEFSATPYPDLILLDINLPYMSGAEFLQLVKADASLRLIPVIVMSSSKAQRDLEDTYQAYANGFVVKPFVPTEYDHVIATIEDYWFELMQTPQTHAADSSVPKMPAKTADVTPVSTQSG